MTAAEVFTVISGAAGLLSLGAFLYQHFRPPVAKADPATARLLAKHERWLDIQLKEA